MLSEKKQKKTLNVFCMNFGCFAAIQIVLGFRVYCFGFRVYGLGGGSPDPPILDFPEDNFIGALLLKEKIGPSRPVQKLFSTIDADSKMLSDHIC